MLLFWYENGRFWDYKARGEIVVSRADGLAREGNLDILMAWGSIVTYCGVKIVDFRASLQPRGNPPV